MRRRKITIIIIVVVALGVTAALLGPYFFAKDNKDNEEVMPTPLIYMTLDELQGKIDGLEAVRADGNLSWQDTYRLGVAYLHSGKPTEAVVVLNEAREAYPRFYKTEEAIGMAHYRLDVLEGAIESWERAIALNPEAEHLEEMIERAKRKRGMRARIDMLEAELERTDIRDKNSPPWAKRLELASIYLVEGRLEDTIEVLNEALAEKDDSSDIYDMLARTYAMSGDFDAAIKAEEMAVKHYKDTDDGANDGEDEELKAMKQRLSEMKRIASAEKSGGFHNAPLE